MFIYNNKQNHQLKFFESVFMSSNFCHLTGVVCKKNLTAKDFFKKCLDHKINKSDFDFRKDGTTEMKLLVLPEIIKIQTSSKMTGFFNSTGVQLYTERLAGGVRGCMGFVKTGSYYVPNTILNQDIREATYSPQHRIVAVFTKNIKDDKYTILDYLAKGFDISELESNKSIWDKILKGII